MHQISTKLVHYQLKVEALKRLLTTIETERNSPTFGMPPIKRARLAVEAIELAEQIYMLEETIKVIKKDSEYQEKQFEEQSKLVNEGWEGMLDSINQILAKPKYANNVKIMNKWAEIMAKTTMDEVVSDQRIKNDLFNFITSHAVEDFKEFIH